MDVYTLHLRRQRLQRRLRRTGRGATAETTPAPDRRKKKKEEESCPTTAKKDEEHPDRNTEKHLAARLPHPGEEAGSIAFHSSSNTSEIRNDNDEARATASAAAKVSEDMSVKDAEILRLIEERRNTPKGDKHKLKDVSKCKKRCIRDKK